MFLEKAKGNEIISCENAMPPPHTLLGDGCAVVHAADEHCREATQSSRTVSRRIAPSHYRIVLSIDIAQR